MTTSDEQPRYMFVYGTLRRTYMRLPIPARRMRPPHVLDECGKWVGEGVLRGFDLWDIGMYPGVVRASGGVVLGDIFDVTNALSMLDVLDQYEGIGGIFEQPFEYRREVVNVEIPGCEDAEKVRAWVYVYNWPLDESKMKRVADGDYVNHSANSI